MISKTLKLSVCVLVLCAITTINAQEHHGKKKHSPEKLFVKLDTNGDGELSMEEFKDQRQREDLKQEMMDDRFKTLDSDDNGTVSLEEFTTRKEKSKEERIKERFEMMDTDGNGSIDFKEYQAHVEQMEGRMKHKRRRH